MVISAQTTTYIPGCNSILFILFTQKEHYPMYVSQILIDVLAMAVKSDAIMAYLEDLPPSSFLDARQFDWVDQYLLML